MKCLGINCGAKICLVELSSVLLSYDSIHLLTCLGFQHYQCDNVALLTHTHGTNIEHSEGNCEGSAIQNSKT